MRNFLRQPHFPLLSKELYEQAMRPRTYWMRFLFGGLIVVIASLELRRQYLEHGTTSQILGIGRNLFTQVILIELAAVFLLVPAMVGPVIAGETQKKTLPLLLITDLRPWEILSQKLIARLIPIATFLLLALPIATVSYMFGGLPISMVGGGVYLLVLSMFLLGSICLWLSARGRTIIGALLSCYLLAPILFMATALIGQNLSAAILGQLNVALGLWPGLTFTYFNNNTMYLATDSLPGPASDIIDFLTLLPVWLACALYFWLARRALKKRLDPEQQGVGELLSAGLPVPRAPRPLPGDEPVAWRQRYTRMGRSRPLRIVTIFVVSLSITIGMAINPGDTLQFGLIIGKLALGVWVIASLLLVLQAASAFSMERSQDTLNVLLATPLGGAELIRQKMVLMRRWMKVTVMVLIIMALLQVVSYVKGAADPWYAFRAGLLPAMTLVLAAVIYLPLLTWGAMLLGLCIHSHERAASTATTVIAAWLLGGYALTMLALEVLAIPRGTAPWNAMLISPATILVEVQFGTIEKNLWGPPWLIVAGNFAVFGFLAYRVRRHVLAHADDYLGRAAQRSVQPLVAAEPQVAV